MVYEKRISLKDYLSASKSTVQIQQLPIEHPDFDKTYFDLEDVINVHGQLTFSDNGKFGFDCCHFDDISPIFGSLKDGHYLTFDEVKIEIEKMVDQFEKRQYV